MGEETKKTKAKPIMEDLIAELDGLVGELVEEWDRYQDSGVKKAGKEARKRALLIKKKAGEIRLAFRDVFPKREKKTKKKK